MVHENPAFATETAGPDHLRSMTLQEKLAERVHALSVPVFLLFTLLASGRAAAAATMLVWFLAGVAVYLPNGLPPRSSAYVAMLMLMQACADGFNAFCRWEEVDALNPGVGKVRSAVALYFAVAELLVAYDVWRCMGQRFWGSMRLALTIGCAVRLLANVFLHSLSGAAAGNYLPGALDYTTSVVFDACCVGIYSVGFSPANRRRLSESFGRASVVCSLAELPVPPDARGDAADAFEYDYQTTLTGGSEWTADPLRVEDELPLRGRPSASRDCGLRAGSLTRRGRAGSASFCSQSSTVSSAGSELCRAFADSDGQLPPPRALPTYKLLPKYYHDTAVYLSTADRVQLELCVEDGMLVDTQGSLLAPDGEAEALFVMDEHGRVLTSLAINHEQLERAGHCVRHSSLVAGGAVAAAGLLTVARGRLLSISNESDHYAPPPSCLHVVLENLATLGAARLNEVVVQPHQP